MRRDVLLLHEMIDAAEQAQGLVAGLSVTEVESDRQRRDALLWNYTVAGEAANAVPEQTRARFPTIPWRSPIGLRNRVVHGYWSVDVEPCIRQQPCSFPGLADLGRSLLVIHTTTEQHR